MNENITLIACGPPPTLGFMILSVSLWTRLSAPEEDFLEVFSQTVHGRRCLIVQIGCTYFSLCLNGRWLVLFMKQFFRAQIYKSSVGRRLVCHVIEKECRPFIEVIVVRG